MKVITILITVAVFAILAAIIIGGYTHGECVTIAHSFKVSGDCR